VTAEHPDPSAFPDGTPLAEIAAALGTTIHDVRQAMEAEPKADLGATHSRAWRSDIRADAVAELYSSGLSLRRIADCFGCDVATVSRRMTAAGMPVRPRRRRGGRWSSTPERLAEMVRRYETGEPPLGTGDPR
jgi:hypothetical protein